MLIISYDALGNVDFETLQKFPAFSALVQKSALYRNVSSVFVSNTYPVHVSVATGLTPDLHGLISNTEAFPANNPLWNNRESLIRVKTLWQAAAEKRIKTAAVLWPVTAYSKTINYNIPEVVARPGKSQVVTSLKAGSAILQLRLFLKYRKLLAGIRQPNLDNFSTACMVDILRKYNPGLALIHLTAFDFLCHEFGRHEYGESPELDRAFEAMDKNLSALLEAAGDDRDIILFSDHSQINVHTIVDPNAELKNRGLLLTDRGGYKAGKYGCYFECCGGSAFFHSRALALEAVEELRKSVEQSEGFRRFLTPEEMQKSGYAHAAFGFCAKEAYCYGKNHSREKANHGYALDIPDYSVFYIIKGSGVQPGLKEGGSLLDIAPFAAKRLGINL